MIDTDSIRCGPEGSDGESRLSLGLCFRWRAASEGFAPGGRANKKTKGNYARGTAHFADLFESNLARPQLGWGPDEGAGAATK